MTLIYGSVITQGHCLSNAMHGQHIIYLCVSVCVFVTLSVNSPTGQTPQRIFTVDSFTGADLCKGVPFGGSRWWIITFRGPKTPKTPISGAWIGISSKICKKIQIAISSDLCIRLTWNLTGSCDQQQRLRGWSCMVVKQFQDGGRPPFWKSIYRHISVNKNLAIANRSRVSCAHKTSTASIGLITHDLEI